MTEEILDLVDINDQVIDQMERSEVYNKRLNNFRVVNVFIVNDEGKLWIPRRTKFKKLFPLCLDASMGGHVVAGESYQQALARELAEELNLDIQNISCEKIGKLTPHEHNTSAFMQVYRIFMNEVPAYNPKDFCESYWFYPQELLERLKQGDQSKGDLPKMVHYLFCK